MTPTREEGTSQTLTREDWLAAALDALPSVGPDGLRIEALAASLGVTKGSFYWHFEDVQDLVSGVFEYWAAKMLDAVRQHDHSTGSAEDRLLRVMEEIADSDLGRYEAAIRSWTRSDERAKSAVTQVDQARLAWTVGGFLELGFSREQAEIRARMLVLYEYGEGEFSFPSTPEQRRAWARLSHEILTGGYRPLESDDRETS